MWQALFLSGDLNDLQRIRTLAEACDLIWTADGGLDRARMLGMKPYMHVGDNDSLSQAGLSYLQGQGIGQLKFPVKKDEPDSALALHYMLDQEYAWRRERKAQVNGALEAKRTPLSLGLTGSGVIFLAGLGSRVDHVLANLDLASRYAQPDLAFLLTDGLTEVWTLVGPCQTYIQLPDHDRSDTYLSLLAVSPEVSGLSLQGTVWPLENRTLYQGINLGISNQPLAGEDIQVQLAQGTLRLVLSREDKAQAKLKP